MIKIPLGSRILISACLTGCKCNYKASAASVNAADASFWNSLFEHFRLLPVCPEQLGGMPTPRVPCELQHNSEAVLAGVGKVLNRDGADMTACFLKGAEEALRFARLHGAELVVFKSRSPSCGVSQVYDGTFSGSLIAGSGVAAQLLLQSGFALLDEIQFREKLKTQGLTEL
ncbi:MAG: DUF523 domain-containing protein [Candidatus Riflebacteria bacterium HGW-Riflebacteria-2]|nr:MAG: DUF523 domain-containing protein [Candidatus Riflebacteria bacterium HGW-Riflebacteria-2]